MEYTKKLEALAKTAVYPVSEEAAQALEGIDRLSSDLMQCSGGKVPQAPHGPLQVQPKSKVVTGHMPCVPIAVDDPNRKESQES